jgi:hypothetical protein
MSANIQERGAVVVLPPEVSPDASVNPSMTRWFYNPYYRINNFGSIGLARHFGAGPTHRYTEFEQGAFYPLKDIRWNEPDLEAAAEQSRAGISSGPVPDIVHVKYAYEQAEELASSFGDRGVVIFQPGLFPRDITWVDDHELVQLVADTLQPRPFKIHEMPAEFGQKAKRRIEKSEELEPEGKELAESFRRLLSAGATLALREVQREYRALIQSMGEAASGRPGIATPNEFHEWVCDQLGVPVPESVHTGKNQTQGTNPSLEKAVEMLAQKALRDDAALEARLAALEGKGRKSKKVEAPEEEEVTA